MDGLESPDPIRRIYDRTSFITVAPGKLDELQGMFEKVVPIIQATHPELLSFQLHLCFHVEKEDRPFEDMVVLKELYLDFGPPNTQPHDESRKYRRFMRSIQGTGLCVIKNVVLNRYDCMPFEEVRG